VRLLKKVFTKIFSLKPSLERATNLKTFCISTIGVGKIARARGLRAEPLAAGGQLGSGGRTSRAWQILQIFSKTKEF